MVNLKEIIQKAAEAFAEEIAAKTAESIKADFIAKLGGVPSVAGATAPATTQKRAGRPKGSKNKANGEVVATHCLEPGCSEKRLAKGLCRKHYYKDRREKNAKPKSPEATHPLENGVTDAPPVAAAAAPF